MLDTCFFRRVVVGYESLCDQHVHVDPLFSHGGYDDDRYDSVAFKGCELDEVVMNTLF